jgi:hypothetical protein
VAHLASLALSFPAVVFTVLLGVSLVYWLFVLIGAVHLDHADGAADGALDGAAEHLGADHAGGDADLDLDVDADGHGGLGAMMAALRLRSAPATVVLSVLALFSWFFSMLLMEAAEAIFASGGIGFTLARFGVLVLAPLVSLLPTSLVVRPLGRIFSPPKAAHHKELVGQICTVRTGTVNERFGEATLEDGGAGLVVRVRIEAGDALKRGDQAVITGYDEDTQEFTVAPMDAADLRK